MILGGLSFIISLKKESFREDSPGDRQDIAKVKEEKNLGEQGVWGESG